MSLLAMNLLAGLAVPMAVATCAFALGDFQLDYLFLMMIIGFVGSIWIFLDAFSRFNFFAAAILTALNIVLLLTTTVPLIFFLYAIFVVAGHIAVWRRTKIDTRGMRDAAEGYGRQVESKDAGAEAARLGLPSVFGEAHADEASRGKAGAAASPEDEIERFIAGGLLEDALKLAQERLKVARRMNDIAGVARWRTIIDRLRRELGDLAAPE
ncbi:MAG: hypothetical protein B1H03_06310 [Planctomycetales bacterium 4484_113]|nr:MAG: hypothetical protein B1H03_06310 [Planctomycetales bacterium 4484_113]